jgi:Flp pilus assembly protein TadG
MRVIRSAAMLGSSVKHIRNQLVDFRIGEGGNVLMTFALSLIPLMGFVGAAVDYSRANSDKAAMQATIDAVALNVSKDVTSLTAAQITQKTTDLFNALFTRKDVSNVSVTSTYSTSPAGSQLIVNASGFVETTILKIMGFSSINLNVTSTIAWGNSKLRLALVLDNTGSMAQSSKMTALKSASHSLLTQLQNAAPQNGDVYVSIIPFAKDVNVDPVNFSQSWIKWSGSADTWDENNGSCSNHTYTTKSTCTAHGRTWTASNHNTWSGCVMDRDQNYDTTNTAPSTGTPATLFPAEQYSSYCPTPLMALSYNWAALNSKIDAMTPNGGTNQAIGLQWGYQSLTAAPFVIPPKDQNYQYKQVIILLSDGLNTQDRWYGDGVNPSPQVDARQQILCNNIKAAGITIYTVQVNTTGDPTSTLLQNCASSPDKFFLLTSSTQIVTTFNQIGTALSNLRVAK